jgi:hypothetical protein
LNFKIIILLFLVSSCGVKGNPSSPEGQTTPSVLDNYPDVQVEQPLKDSVIRRK